MWSNRGLPLEQNKIINRKKLWSVTDRNILFTRLTSENKSAMVKKESTNVITNSCTQARAMEKKMRGKSLNILFDISADDQLLVQIERDQL